MSGSRATLLGWFPYECETLERLLSDAGVTVEEEGPVHRAMRRAWFKEPSALRGTLRDDPDAWAELLGARWKPLSAAVRKVFGPDPEHPGRLRMPWLYAKYREQQQKYENRARPGAEGGHATAAKRPPGTPARRNGTAKAGSNAASNGASNGTAKAGSNVALEVRTKRDYVPTAFQAVGDVRPPAADAAAAGAPPGGALASSATADGPSHGHGPPEPVAPDPVAPGAIAAAWGWTADPPPEVQSEAQASADAAAVIAAEQALAAVAARRLAFEARQAARAATPPTPTEAAA